MFTKLKKPAKIILSDGTEYEGISIGKEGTRIGEIVFNTAMTGYLETLTDASYFGQIVMQTFPLVGNYGVNLADYEGRSPKVFGYIVKSICSNPSNFNNKEVLEKFLIDNNIVAIESVDTRSLTEKIREKGVLNCAITTEEIKNKEELLEKINDFKIINAVEKTSIKNKKQISGSNSSSNIVVCVLDFGVKRGIVKNLKQHAKEVIILPYNATKEDVKNIKPDGIVLSNGPGDPMDNKTIINNLKEIQSLNIPILGICLGHQLLAIANSFKTTKLKYGHRGANHPVLDLALNKILITSQNHGYCVDSNSIDENIAQMSHININDKTCEGIKYKNIPAFTVQFHPEACAGPQDSNFLFERFFSMIKSNSKKLN